MVAWLSHCVISARAYGLDILDGVYNDIADIEGFRRECAQGDEHGIRRQDPDPSEPDRALQRGVLTDAGRARARLPDHRRVRPAGNRNKGVVQVGGRMVERLHAEMARRTVAIAEAIAARDK